VIYSLDSSVAIEMLRTRRGQAPRARLQAVLDSGKPIFVSSVVLHELMTGAMKGNEPTRSLEKLDRFLSRLMIVEFTGDDAICAGRVRTELENRGTVIGAMDTLIAGHALARGWTLVASDDHFLRVDGLGTKK
jgi:tRNA(fMet)-specific endonuclease VapC